MNTEYKKLGFIGCGEMAGAIIKGLLGSGFINSENIIATKSSSKDILQRRKALGIDILTDNKELVQKTDIVFFAVKPKQVKKILKEIKNVVKNKLIVSIVAGLTIEEIEKELQTKNVIRVMPNMPVSLGVGMSGICYGKNVSDSDIEYVKSVFDSIGKTIIVQEAQMDIVTAISGSGPAFFYKIINDIALAGKKLGLDYQKSLILSVQTALGSVKMVQQNEISMDELINSVATEGGCTLEGIKKMEEMDSSKMFFDTIKSTVDKLKNLN